MTTLDTAPQALGPAADPVRDSTSVTGTGATRRTLTIGPHTIDTPVVLAPMAGITNMAFRLLCREFGAMHSADDGGLFVGEMVTTRALVEGHRESWRLVTMGERETPRSVQLYGVDPATVRRAVEMIRERDLADHIDLNFGCPVPKVTRRGGGGVLPWKTELFTRIVSAAVQAAGPEVPVTVKTRIGIDDEHQTFRDAGLIAQEVGAAAIALHGRTVVQHYSGQARWQAITELKELVTDIPVLGNGDIWSAEDAIEMMEQTGCDGVVVASPGSPTACAPPSARSRGSCAATPSCWSSSTRTRAARCATCASTWPGTTRATPSAGRCATAWRRWSPSPTSTPSSPSSTATAPTPAQRSRGRGAAPARPRRRMCPRAG